MGQAADYARQIGISVDPTDVEAYETGRMSWDEYVYRQQRRAAPNAYSPEDIASGASNGSTHTEAAPGWDGTTLANEDHRINYGTDDASTIGTGAYHPTSDTEIGRVQRGEIPGWSRPEVVDDWINSQFGPPQGGDVFAGGTPFFDERTGMPSSPWHTPGAAVPQPMPAPPAYAPPVAQAGSQRPSLSMMAPPAYRPFTETYSAPQNTERFQFDPSELSRDAGYQSEVSDTIRAADRSASARGLSFTNQAREDLIGRVGDLASRRIGDAFNRQLSTFGTNRDTFDANAARGLAGYQTRADVWDRNEGNRFSSERANLGDERAWDSTLWNRGDTDRRFAADRGDVAWGQGRQNQLDLWGRSNDLWSQDRTNTQDQWGRGLDVFNMNRTNRQDQFDNQFRLSDLVLRNRPSNRVAY